MKIINFHVLHLILYTSQLRFALNDLMARPTFPKHRLQITRNLARNLPSSEMAASLLEGLVHDVTKSVRPCRWNDCEFSWRMCEAELDFADPLLCAISMNSILGMCGFVVDPETRGRTGGGEPVDAYPG